ncbi:hypothetical protein Tco_0011291 [Tanacetum coccineum]
MLATPSPATVCKSLQEIWCRRLNDLEIVYKMTPHQMVNVFKWRCIVVEVRCIVVNGSSSNPGGGFGNPGGGCEIRGGGDGLEGLSGQLSIVDT